MKGISRKDSIRNVTIRQQIGLEETIIKEIEQNQLTWYGHVQRTAEGHTNTHTHMKGSDSVSHNCNYYNSTM